MLYKLLMICIIFLYSLLLVLYFYSFILFIFYQGSTENHFREWTPWLNIVIIIIQIDAGLLTWHD